jgi:hypothetical protein
MKEPRCRPYQIENYLSNFLPLIGRSARHRFVIRETNRQWHLGVMQSLSSSALALGLGKSRVKEKGKKERE